jgi:hypothetical protein
MGCSICRVAACNWLYVAPRHAIKQPLLQTPTPHPAITLFPALLSWSPQLTQLEGELVKVKAAHKELDTEVKALRGEREQAVGILQEIQEKLRVSGSILLSIGDLWGATGSCSHLSSAQRRAHAWRSCQAVGSRTSALS